MKRIIYAMILLLTVKASVAQTWTGAVSTNWNLAGNWSPAAVPTSGSYVTIPGALAVYPALASNVTINGINMQSGSQLNVNGFTLTINSLNVYDYFSGATINNTNGATDIVININTGINGYAAYFRSCTVNDHITFNLTGTASNVFYEGDVAPFNQFNGNVTYNINDVLPVYLSQGAAAQYNGNLTINRTVAGGTNLFASGAAITGNFSYTNNAGGGVIIGNVSTLTNITGTVNIACNYPSPAGFEMTAIKNQTTGGIINVQNSIGMLVRKDTLKVTSLSVTGITGNGYAYFLNNSITGNVTLSDDASYSGGYTIFLRSNVITGNSTFSVNGTNNFYDADGAADANTYNGNVTYNGNGGPLYIAQGAALTCTGNVTINRTAAGYTNAFANGSTITGNLAYTNNTTGDSYFGGLGVKTSIGGTINMTVNYSSNSIFQLYRLINQTTGGSINVTGSRAMNISNDTLKLTALSITAYTGNAYANFFNNKITGNVTLTADATYTGGYATYIRNNEITGNSTFSNNCSNNFYEADGLGTSNHFTGNTVFNAGGTGTLYVSQGEASIYDGNLTINRSAPGVNSVFNSGGTVNGNFAFSNNTYGDTYLGTNAVKTNISGTINITASYTTPNFFEMYRLANQTNGGSINVSNSQGFTIQNDTLKVTALNITGYTGNRYGYLYTSSITGNVNIADAAGYISGYITYIRSNVITGNSSFTINGTNTFNDADAGSSGNTYNGNVSYNATNSAQLFIAHGDVMQCTGNVTVARTVAGTTFIFLAGSTVAGNFSYTNNAGGFTSLGQINNKTAIGGTVNISVNDAAHVGFEMYRLVNQTPGGVISIQNTGGYNVQRDTLVVNSVSLTGYRGNYYAYFLNNSITGNFTSADDVTYTTGYTTYIRSNVITGNTNITNNGTNVLLDADASSYTNKYIGNVTFTRNAGTMSIGTGDFDEVTQNLTLNFTGGVTVGSIKFNGSTNSIIDQVSTLPITMNTLAMAKTGAGKLTLNDSVTVTGTATFTSGNIYSSATANLIFPNGIGYTGGSAASHVVGPVAKIGSQAFTFPVGSPVSYNPVTISAPVNITDKFRAEYKNQNPGSDGYNTTLKAGSFGAAQISKAGYWDVQRLSGTTNVTLSLGFSTNPYETYPTPLTTLKVAHWNGAQWDDHGNGGTTGTTANGTVVNSTPITSFSPFTLAGMNSTYFYVYSNPGTGPDGTPVKFLGSGGYPAYSTRQLPAGAYTTDSVYLIPNASSAGFKLKDNYGVEKDDTTVTAPTAPTTYVTANGNGTVNFTGWRNFVYMTAAGNNIMGAVKDNGLTLGTTTMNTYFSTAAVATSPNGNIYLKRSFKITSQFAPVGTKRVRLYISKTEFTNLTAADPTSFPSGINSLTITKYSGPQEDSLFNPIPGGNTVIIPNSAITIVDLGTMYSLDIDVTGFSGFYIGGNNSNFNTCSGATVSLPSNISGATYQWQADSGSGYVNISNTGAYSGTTTNTLTITNTPGSLYGYKFRCVVNGGTFSQVYTLKFNSSWNGTVSNIWENAANWSCGVLPDANTDVIINAGKPNYPQLGVNATIRTLKANTGATVTIKTGANLTILK